jgi:hypothetical protein
LPNNYRSFAGVRAIAARRYNRFVGLVILRVVIVCHVLGAFVQSVFAGQFLSGSDGPVRFHELTGLILLPIAAIQILVAALLLRSGRTSLWLVLGSVLLFLGEGLQIGTGYGRFLDVHIPLGVIIAASASWQAITVFLKPTRPLVPGNEV